MCICNKPLPLFGHLQLSPQSSVYTHHLQPQPLPALVYSWNRISLFFSTEHHRSSFSHFWFPEVLTKYHRVISAVNLAGWPKRTWYPSETQCCHFSPHMGPCTIKPDVTACSRVFPPPRESLPFPKSVHKIWKSWLLLQMYRQLCQSYKDYEESRKQDSTKGIQQASCN